MRLSSTLETLDCGIPIAQRAWPLTDDASVVEDGYLLTDCCEVLIFSLPKSYICSNPTSFDQFDVKQNEIALMNALYQLFWRSVEQMIATVRDSDAVLLNNDSFPVKIFLECVLESEEARREHRSRDYDGDEKLRIAKHLQSLYGAELCNVDDIMDGARSKLESSVFHRQAMERIKFMKGCDDREVFEYRFWFVMSDPKVQLSQQLASVLHNTFDLFYKNYGAGNNGPFEESRGKKNKRGAGGSGGGGAGDVAAGGGGASFKKVLSEYQRWAMIKSHDDYLNAVSVYTNDSSFRREHVRNKCLSLKVPIEHANNPANPGEIFDARNYFTRTRTSVFRDRLQNTAANYIKGPELKFPRPECVLRVGTQWWNVHTMHHVYTPDTQKRFVEPRLDRGLGKFGANSHTSESNQSVVQTNGVAGQQSTTTGTVGLTRNNLILANLRTNAPVPSPADNGMNWGESRSRLVNIRVNTLDSSVANVNSDAAIFGEMSEDGDDSAYDNLELEQPSKLRRGANRTEQLPATDVASQQSDVTLTPVPAAAVVRQVPAIDGPPSANNPYVASGNYSVNDYGASAAAAAGATGGDESSTNSAHQTQLHTLRNDYTHRSMRFIRQLKDDLVRSSEMLLMQFRAMEEYISKCTKSNSVVSKPGQCINEWMEQVLFEQQSYDDGRAGAVPTKSEFPLAFTDCADPYLDTKMSLFGNMIAAEFLGYEHLLFAYTAHPELHLVRAAAMSAYWYAFDQLRLNICLYGPPQTSKSWPISMVRQILIEYSTSSITNISKQSEAHDADDNDLPRLFEEVPDEIILKSSKNTELKNVWKEMMTRNVVTRRVLAIVDGVRVIYDVRSEKHTNTSMATNAPRPAIDEAIASRCVMRNQVTRRRQGVDIADRTSAAKNPTRQQEKDREHFVHNLRLRQALFYHLEKGKMIGWITEPTLACLSLIYPRYKRVLSRQFAISIARRVDDQINVFVRVLTFENAIYWLYHSPDSPCYASKRISFWHLLALNPMLHDTEEIVYYALDHFRDSFVDPNQEAVVKCLRDDIVTEMLARGMQLHEMFETNAERREREQGSVLGKQPGTKPKSRGGANGTTATMSSRKQQNRVTDARQYEAELIDEFTVDGNNGAVAAPAPGCRTSNGVSGASEFRSSARDNARNYNYVVFKLKFDKVVTAIASAMRRTKSARELNKDTVKSVLRQLMTRQILSKPYVMNAQTNSIELSRDPRAKTQLYSAVKVSEDERAMYFHSSLVFGSERDPHLAALAACRTAYVPRGSKFISGRAVDENNPHLLKTYLPRAGKYEPTVRVRTKTSERVSHTVAPDNDSTGASNRSAVERNLFMKSIRKQANGANSDDAQKTRFEQQAIEHTYDEYSTRMRLEKLGIPRTAAAIAKCNYVTSDERARAKLANQPGFNAHDSIDYPQDLVPTHTRQHSSCADEAVVVQHDDENDDAGASGNSCAVNVDQLGDALDVDSGDPSESEDDPYTRFSTKMLEKSQVRRQQMNNSASSGSQFQLPIDIGMSNGPGVPATEIYPARSTDNLQFLDTVMRFQEPDKTQ